MTYRVSVSITDGNNAMTSSYNPIVSDNDKLKDVITNILLNEEVLILDKFPTNQWRYQWIISSEIDHNLESFFTAFNVVGDQRFMNALLNDSPMSGFVVGEYVLSFEGY